MRLSNKTVQLQVPLLWHPKTRICHIRGWEKWMSIHDREKLLAAHSTLEKSRNLIVSLSRVDLLLLTINFGWRYEKVLSLFVLSTTIVCCSSTEIFVNIFAWITNVYRFMLASFSLHWIPLGIKRAPTRRRTGTNKALFALRRSKWRKRFIFVKALTLKDMIIFALALKKKPMGMLMLRSSNTVTFRAAGPRWEHSSDFLIKDVEWLHIHWISQSTSRMQNEACVFQNKSRWSFDIHWGNNFWPFLGSWKSKHVFLFKSLATL